MLTWPAWGVSGGKWISPSVGVQGELNEMSSRSWNPGDSYDIIQGGKPYFTKFDHVEFSVDMLFNLHNLFLGVNEKRRFSVIYYLGPGIAYTYNNFKVANDTHMIFKSGGMLMYRLRSGFSVFGNLQGTIVPQKFSGEHFFRSYEGYLTPMVGIQYVFPKRGFSKCCPCNDTPDQTYLAERLNKLQEHVYSLQTDSAKCADRPVVVQVVDTCRLISGMLSVVKSLLAPATKDRLYQVIYFDLDQTKIQPQERYKLTEIAEFIRNHPDNHICIAGYADVKTASSAYNMSLSKKRSQAIKSQLSSVYDVSTDNVECVGFGDKIQPFNLKNLNRSVIVYDVGDSQQAGSVGKKDNGGLEIYTASNTLNVAVHFLIDKWNIRPSEYHKLDTIASYMRRNPQDSVFVGGYADVQTAYPAYNKRLGDKRAQSVIAALVNNYHIARNRFAYYSFGDSVQPFKINDLNRAAIAINKRKAAIKIAMQLPECKPSVNVPVDSCQIISNEWNNLLKQIRHPAKKKVRMAIFFEINKWHVKASEMYKIDDLVRFLILYPELKLSVTGYADVKTAYPAYNLQLSQRRTAEVIRLLTEQYGIDRARLSANSVGDTIQPFSVNEQNRVVLAFEIEE
jgi:outer membrane protein OmpA-like peptidoglycan-associated protein